MSRVSYKRQRDNLLYEKLMYTGEYRQATHYTIIWYDGDHYTSRQYSDAEELTSAVRADGVNWISVCGLSDLSNLEKLFVYFDIDRLWMQDIVNTRHIAKIDEAEGDVLAVADYFYRTTADDVSSLSKEHLAILMKGNVVVTFQETACSRFGTIEKAVEDRQLKLRHQNSGYLFNLLLSTIVDGYLVELDYQREALLDAESEMLAHDISEDMGRSLQQMRSDFLAFRKNVLPLRGEFVHLRETSVAGDDNFIYYTDTHDHLEQVFQMIESEQALIASLYDFFVTANDQRLNRIVSRLTILSAVFIPLTFMAGIWGMNFSVMPELSFRWGYPIALLSMALVAAGVLVYFKWKKWL